MQTKLKPILLLVTLVATALLLYAANDAQAQSPTMGIFDVSTFSPNVISISPKLARPDKVLQKDSTLKAPLPAARHEIPAGH